MPKIRSLYSAATLRTLMHAFGMRAMPFFEFYDSLKEGSLGGEPPPEGYVDTFRDLSRLIVRTLTTEVSKAKLLEVTQQIRPLLHQLDLDQGSKHLYVRIAGLYASLIMDVAADQEVFLTTIPSGSVGWVMLRMMSDKEQKVERLRRSDPAHFDAIQQTRTLRKEIDRRVEQAVVDLGMTPSKKMVMGRPVITGIDPISQDELVFTDDGEYATVPEFITKRRQEAQARKETTRVFPNIEDLRKFGDEEIDALTVGDIEYVAMTDDKAKSHNLTRIYPTKRMIDGTVVVVSGRYKGFLIDDLVNRAGRMIEGVAYDMDPKSGLPVVMETKDPNTGNPVVRANREPYVTVGSKGDLYLRIPATKQYTAVRNAVAELSKIVPSLQYEAGSRKAVFTFTPAEFAAVREALGGVALSKSAAKALQEHFAGMAKHELALSASNLQHFDTDRIGGFKPGKRLFHKQKEAMAWLESNGHSGVMALGTGVGKTSLALASMQKMVRDGLLGEDQQFLYVCPPALRGNLPKEMEAFLEDPKALRSRVRIMTYPEFAKATKADPDFALHYAAVMFDEAQALKNPTSGTAAAAMALRHPKKILFTASPMEKSPMEVFSLVAVTNNLNLNTREGRAQIKAFRKRFCEEVGGKIIGIKNDPVTARDFRIWVKQNLYFADKRDVEEIALPELHATSVAVTMHPEIEARYRQVSSGIANVIKGMVAKYRDRSISATDPAIESARIKLAKQFRALFNLINFPESIVPGASNPKVEHVVSILDERVGSGRRTLLFTDSPDLAKNTAKSLSERFPVHYHAECAADTIRIWRTGSVVKTYPAQEYTEGDRTWPKTEWKGYVLDRVISPRPDIMSCVLTSTYSTGQNLQSFDTVVHLDRDAWNNETMKQRTARAWRTGQNHSVDEYTLDAVYANPDGDADTTIDQIAGYLQGLEADLFDRVIVESQTEALGKEWFGMKQVHSSFLEINRRLLELQMSPYATRLGRQ